MNKDNKKNENAELTSPLQDEDFRNPYVGKILFKENKELKKEIVYLKKSLKQNQNKLEKLRGTNHELDKKNYLMTYKLKTIFLPEFIKFISSAVGAGIAVNFFFNNQTFWGIFSLVVSISIYGLMLFLYRK